MLAALVGLVKGKLSVVVSLLLARFFLASFLHAAEPLALTEYLAAHHPRYLLGGSMSARLAGND